MLPTSLSVTSELTGPAAHETAADDSPTIRSVVLCATPGAGEDIVARAFEACGLGTPRPWLDVRRVAPALLEQWELTALDDYLAALQGRRTTADGIFGLVLHWHDLRRVHRQVAGLRQPTAQRMLDIVEVLAPQPVFVRVRRADRSAHVDALQALEQDDDAAPDRSASELARLRARIDATEIVWTQWFDAIGVKPREAVYEDVVADPTVARDMAADLVRALAGA